MRRICKACGKILTSHPSGMCPMCMSIGKAHPLAASCSAAVKANAAFPIDVEKVKNLGLPSEGVIIQKEKDMPNYKVTCSVEGCEKWAVKDGLCVAHYKEKHGCSPKWGGKEKKASGQPAAAVAPVCVRITAVASDFDVKDLISYGRRLIREEVRLALKEMLNAN